MKTCEMNIDKKPFLGDEVSSKTNSELQQSEFGIRVKTELRNASSSSHSQHNIIAKK